MGQQPKRVGGVPAVGHAGEILGQPCGGRPGHHQLGGLDSAPGHNVSLSRCRVTDVHGLNNSNVDASGFTAPENRDD